MKKILKILAVALCFFAAQFAPLALATFNSTGGSTYFTQANISSSQSTILLTSFTEPSSGIPYTMSYINTNVIYGTLNPESSNSEFISATGITQNANGTALLTGVTRGLARTPGTGGCVASTTLAHAFPGQTKFVLSAPPCFFNQYPAKQNDETITGQWTFDTFPITPSNSPASETVAGIVEIATGAEAAAGTTNGSVGRLALPASLATSTYNSQTAANVVPVTGLTGQIASQFVATSSLYAWIFPTGSGAASTTLVNNGSGTVAWNPYSTIIRPSVSSKTAFSGNATYAFATVVPANMLGTRNTVRVIANGMVNDTSGGTCVVDVGYANSTTTVIFTNPISTTKSTMFTATYTLQGNGSTNAQKAFFTATTASTSPWVVTTATSSPAIDSTADRTLTMLLTAGGTAGCSVDLATIEVLR